MPLFNDAGWGVITEGCKTTHGGTVLPVSRTFTDVGGATRSVAMVGDMTHCPKCKGDFPIVEGDPPPGLGMVSKWPSMVIRRLVGPH